MHKTRVSPMVYPGGPPPRVAHPPGWPIPLGDGPILGCIFLNFNGGSKYGEFLWVVGPCIRLWFALSGVLVD